MSFFFFPGIVFEAKHASKGNETKRKKQRGRMIFTLLQNEITIQRLKKRSKSSTQRIYDILIQFSRIHYLIFDSISLMIPQFLPCRIN